VTAPFLLELAADPELPERHEIVALLAHLAVGYDKEWLPETIPIARIRRRLPPAAIVEQDGWSGRVAVEEIARLRAAAGDTGADQWRDLLEQADASQLWWQPSSSAMAVADQPCSDNSSITARVATRHWPCSSASRSGRAWSGRLGVDGGGAQTGPASCGRCGRWPTRLLGSRTQLTIHYGQHFWSQAYW
jgi:hypothetical protein